MSLKDLIEDSSSIVSFLLVCIGESPKCLYILEEGGYILPFLKETKVGTDFYNIRNY